MTRRFRGFNRHCGTDDASAGARPDSRRSLVFACGAAFGLAIVGTQACAQDSADSPRPSVSVRAWTNTWDSWVTSPKGTGVALGTQRYQIVQAVNGGTRTSIIPVVSLRHGNFIESLSVMPRTSYSFQDAGTPGGYVVRASRSELDLNSGYRAGDNITLTAGYKRLTQTYGPDTFVWRGALVGINAHADLGSGWYLYSSAGLGYMKAIVPESQKDARQRTRFNADYRLGEFGVGFNPDIGGSFIKSTVLTIGYRTQTVTTRDYTLGTTDPTGSVTTPNATTSLVDTTQGLAASVVLIF